MSTLIQTPVTDALKRAFCFDSDAVYNGASIAHYMEMAAHAEKLEQELAIVRERAVRVAGLLLHYAGTADMTAGDARFVRSIIPSGGGM